MFEGFTTTDIETPSSHFGGARIHLRHGGDGPPLLLLHGNPLTHVSWHKIANRLAEHFHVVATDLRGYGDSVGPDDAGPNNINYSFRAMAQDQVEVMEMLGYREFFVAGHDRGARTTARMCLDHPERVKRAALVDILPNHHIWTHTSREWALRSWHWALMAPGSRCGNEITRRTPGAAPSPAAITCRKRPRTRPTTISCGISGRESLSWARPARTFCRRIIRSGKCGRSRSLRAGMPSRI